MKKRRREAGANKVIVAALMPESCDCGDSASKREGAWGIALSISSSFLT
jgi:hypothetical protein